MALFGVDETVIAVLAPFAAALVAPTAVRMFWHNAAWLLAIVPALVFLHFFSYVGAVSQGQTFEEGFAWVRGYGVNFTFYLDGLAVLFALIVSGIGTLIILYAGGYMKGHPQQGRFMSFLFLFMGSMLGVVTGSNLLTLFIFWELTSITSFLLIGFDHLLAASRRAAMQALVVTGGGGLALLAGLLMIMNVTGETEMSNVIVSGEALRNSSLYIPILIMVLLGAFTKSAQFPFHFWLPNAMEAPTPVSAFLHSATMVKAGVYLLMRLNPVLGDTAAWITILPFFGGLTLLVGTLLAVRQTDLKLILAYTTVASLGLLVMLTGAGSEVAIEGAVIYLFAHALFKGSLFMVAGLVDHECGTRDLMRLGGLRKAMPITFLAAVLAALSMGGLPPFIGFIGKEMLYDGTWNLADNALLLTVVAVLGNGLMLAAAFGVAFKPFLGAPTKTPKHAHEGPVLMWLGPLTLAFCGLAAAVGIGWTGGSLIAPMAGAPVHGDYHLIPAHISAPFYLSLITIALGLFIFCRLDAVRQIMARVLKAIGWGPDRGFDQFISLVVRFAGVFTAIVQPGKMQVYMNTVFVVVALALLVPMGLYGEAPSMPAMPDFHFYEWLVLALIVMGVIAVLVARTRLIAIVSLGIQGFAVAVLYMLFGAPDLSFTQFMVETLSVVILALVMTRLNLSAHDNRPFRETISHAVIAIAGGIGFGALLLAVTQVPFDSRLSDFFAANSRVVAHGRNIVNVIIVDFRGFDTMGEISVVMITGLAILALIRVRKRGGKKEETPPGDGSLAPVSDAKPEVAP
ncbi:putative monovalent cation/H+ antiporter subunit A [Breoghania sp.]|uniref:putative monovalent cation/H+ antiporter subunit A n=1 Tax=Breoghania sp. TaxID=2065378 RepID=UPI002604ED4F|nr:putative monovalent cation/H+ antiporter subunit A [Breoghania sp.]MDJ0931787.1 putative monovalent cation/H+ antiporter subunit A [Breoghania sp.]